MILKINSKSRTSEMSATATSILSDLSNRDFSNDPFMTALVGKLTGNNALMTEALKEKAAHSILGPIDEKRDNLLRAIFHEVIAKELWPNETVSNAAARVAVELDKYGFETIDLAYAAESANINALVQDLKKPEVVDAISNLPGFSELVVHLKAAQQEFETAFLQFVDLKIEKGKLLSATKLGKLMRFQINKELVVYLNAMALSMPEQYKECAEVIEVIIETNNTKVRNRLKKSDDEPPKE
jgi:hypothetical protein